MWEIERVSHKENTENTPCSRPTILHLSETYEYTDILTAFTNYLGQIYNERKQSANCLRLFHNVVYWRHTTSKRLVHYKIENIPVREMKYGFINHHANYSFDYLTWKKRLTAYTRTKKSTCKYSSTGYLPNLRCDRYW